MTKTIATMPLNYIYDANHNRSHYLIEGIKGYKNGGEFAEIVCKAIRGYKAEKDANTSFDKGSDIEETKTSIKSNACGLTDEKTIRTTREYYYEQYFKRVHSTNVDYVIIIDDMVYIYNMDMHTEFKEFVDTFSYWDNHSKKIRINTTLKMINWLEERVA